jgi:hypothetical protein
VGRVFVFYADESPCSILQTAASQLFLLRGNVYNCNPSHTPPPPRDALVLRTDNNRLATGSSDIITVNLDSLVKKSSIVDFGTSQLPC